MLRYDVKELGYQGRYSMLTRALHRYRPLPMCELRQSGASSDSGVIEHSAGQETQFDWLELPNSPGSWAI